MGDKPRGVWKHYDDIKARDMRKDTNESSNLTVVVLRWVLSNGCYRCSYSQGVKINDNNEVSRPFLYRLYIVYDTRCIIGTDRCDTSFQTVALDGGTGCLTKTFRRD